jgi:hypothetical protein
VSDDPGLRVIELVLDPTWHTARLSVGGIAFLRIQHPRHGNIDVGFSESSLTALHEALGRLIKGPVLQ